MFVKYTSILWLVVVVACGSQEPKVQNEEIKTWADQEIVAASGDLAHGSQESKEAQQAGDKALEVLGTQEDKASSEIGIVFVCLRFPPELFCHPFRPRHC